MALTVNSNIQAMNAYRNLNKTQSALSSSLEKLSSGLRINRAADDAAGLAISEGLKAQIGGIQQASKNAQDGVSVVQTADGALAEQQTILQRLRTLSVNAANGSQSAESRGAINAEASALKAELTRISNTSSFNGVNLLDGSYAGGVNFQVGYKADSGSVTGNVVSVGISSGAASVTAATSAALVGSTTITNVAGSYAASPLMLTFRIGSSNVTYSFASANVASNFASIVTDFNAGFGVANKLSLAFATSFTITDTTGTGSSSTVSLFSVSGGGTNVTGLSPATVGGKDVAKVGSFNAAGLSVDTVDLGTIAGATVAIAAVDAAITKVSTVRAGLGALQNRFQYTVDNLDTTAENLSASESRITDTDMASEMVMFTRSQILAQAGTSMLAQAKNLPQSILDLLKA